MTVKELIEQLQQLPSEATVYIDSEHFPTSFPLDEVRSDEWRGWDVETGDEIISDVVILSHPDYL